MPVTHRARNTKLCLVSPRAPGLQICQGYYLSISSHGADERLTQPLCFAQQCRITEQQAGFASMNEEDFTWGTHNHCARREISGIPGPGLIVTPTQPQSCLI